MAALLVICLAFLCGSFPSGVVVSARRGRDPRLVGSGNIGAANVVRAAGFRAGAVVAVIDVLKGFLPVLLSMWLGLGQVTVALVGVAAVLGHDFSIFLRFRGGKGVATTLGVALGLAPAAAALAVITWGAVFLMSRYSSVSSLAALAALPLFVALTREPEAFVVVTFALFLLGAAKHWDNILRLMMGKEPKMGARSTVDGA